MTLASLAPWLPVIDAALGTIIGIAVVALVAGGLILDFIGHPKDQRLSWRLFLIGAGALRACCCSAPIES